MSGDYSLPRAKVNHAIKSFMNQTIPDLLAYRGIEQEKIHRAVSESTCWTFAGGWDDLPVKGSHICKLDAHDKIDNILNEDHFFVSHSLGSRIVIDTLSQTVDIVEDLAPTSDVAQKLFHTLQHKEMNLFMLSNQLPLLQIGQKKPDITENIEAYCTAAEKKYAQRIFQKLNLVAFSDPNDILSYPVPPYYADYHIDSRLCPNIINVNLNVTHNKKLFGVNFANPAEAHSGYLEDDRIIAMIADGLSREKSHPLVKEKCRWIETIK